MAVKTIEEIESELAPQVMGIILPINEPAIIPNQINFFESILVL